MNSSVAWDNRSHESLTVSTENYQGVPTVSQKKQKHNHTTRGTRLATYSFLLGYFWSSLWPFSSQRFVTAPSWSRTRFEIRHPLDSERLEVHLQYTERLIMPLMLTFLLSHLFAKFNVNRKYSAEKRQTINMTHGNICFCNMYEK